MEIISKKQFQLYYRICRGKKILLCRWREFGTRSSRHFSFSIVLRFGIRTRSVAKCFSTRPNPGLQAGSLQTWRFVRLFVGPVMHVPDHVPPQNYAALSAHIGSSFLFLYDYKSVPNLFSHQTINAKHLRSC